MKHYILFIYNYLFISPYKFAYIFILLSLIFFLLAVFFKNFLYKKTFLLFFSLFFSLFCIEFILAFNNTDKFNDYTQGSEIKPLSTKNLKKIIDTYTVSDTNFEGVLYNTYENGFRYTQCDMSSNESYVFFGCSFVFGNLLSDTQTLTYYFSKLMNFKANVLNCGCQGRSSNTALNILKSDIFDSFIKKNSNIKLFVYTLMDQSVNRNFQYTGNRDWIYKNGVFVYPEQPYEFILKNFAKCYLFNAVLLDIFNRINRTFYENYMLDSLIQMDQIIKTKYNSKLLIIVWKIENSMTIKLKNSGLNILFLPQYFDYEPYRLKDFHPAPKANDEIAKMIFDYIKKNEI